MYLIIGATGHVGSEVVTQMLKRGHAVRAMVRATPRPGIFPEGVDVAVGDLDDINIGTAAARGVEGVFLMQVNPAARMTFDCSSFETQSSMYACPRIIKNNKIMIVAGCEPSCGPLPFEASTRHCIPQLWWSAST